MSSQVVDLLNYEQLEPLSNCFVYKITNKTDGKCFVGKTCKGKVRFYYLVTSLKNNSRTSPILKEAVNKYGMENFTLEILGYAKSEEDINDLWYHHMDCENCVVPNGYNIQGMSKVNKHVKNKTKPIGNDSILSEDTTQKLETIPTPYVSLYVWEDMENYKSNGRLHVLSGIDGLYLHEDKLEYFSHRSQYGYPVSFFSNSFDLLNKVLVSPNKIDKNCLFDKFLDECKKRGIE